MKDKKHPILWKEFKGKIVVGKEPKNSKLLKEIKIKEFITKLMETTFPSK